MDRSYCAQQFIARRSLYDVSARSGGKCALDVCIPFERRENDDANAGRMRKDLARQFVTAHVLEPQIDNSHVWNRCSRQHPQGVGS